MCSFGRAFVPRWMAVITLVCFTATAALIGCGVGTDYWTLAEPFRRLNSTAYVPCRARACSFHTGMFNGRRVVDFGLGARDESFSVLADIDSNSSFFSIPIWIATLSALGCSLVLCIVGFISATVTAVKRGRTRPACGPLGLLTWSVLALTTTVVACVLHVAQFHFRLSENVLRQEHVDSGLSSQGMAWFGYSYWLIVASCFPLVCIIAMLCASRARYGYDEEEMANDKMPYSAQFHDAVFMY